MKTDNHWKGLKRTFLLLGWGAAMALTSIQTAQAETWTLKADMPTARLIRDAEVVNGRIYVIGGVWANLRKVEEYDPATDTWAVKADMPTKRTLFATGVVNGKIYVIGGGTSLYASAGATVEEYDPATDTWTQKADMPTPRTRSAASVVDGKIYVIGGGGGGGASYPTMSTVEAYDPATDTWTRQADMPSARELLSTSVVGGKIYAIGGQRQDSVFQGVYSTVEMYDPATDRWTKKADTPLPRKVHSACVLKDIIYVFGGRTVIGARPQSTLFQYDPAADAWVVGKDMPYSVAAAGAGSVDGHIYLIGGSSAPSYPFTPALSTVWEYIPSPDFDFNKDGVVDARDMSMMVDHWQTEDSRFDVAPAPVGDGIVDVQDLVALSEHLFEDFRIVAHWMLDEAEGLTAYDSAGDQNGDVIGNPVWRSTGGQTGGALELDGVDDYVGTPFVRNPAEGPFSVFAWIRGGAPGQVLVSQLGGADWLATDALTGALATGLRGNDRSSGPLVSQTAIADGQWHRVGFTWGGSLRSLYVDGLLVAEDPESGLIPAGGGLNIGCGALLEPGSFFAGRIDDVVVYDHAIEP
jgi:N-acetylneuraminic acid mutarotase